VRGNAAVNSGGRCTCCLSFFEQVQLEWLNVANEVILLAIVQGLAELLPVSSSAHVVIAERLLGLDPSSPPMRCCSLCFIRAPWFAVIVYSGVSGETHISKAQRISDLCCPIDNRDRAYRVVGELIISLSREPYYAVFHMPRLKICLAIWSLSPGSGSRWSFDCFCWHIQTSIRNEWCHQNSLTLKRASLIGIVQGLCLPFRGFSRSGATISTGMLLGVTKSDAETFSFALAVVITPPL